MSPIRLTDDQLGQLLRIARPLPFANRDRFLELLAEALRDRVDVGDGELHILMREIIRTHALFVAPTSFETGARPRRRPGGSALTNKDAEL